MTSPNQMPPVGCMLTQQDSLSTYLTYPPGDVNPNSQCDVSIYYKRVGPILTVPGMKQLKLPWCWQPVYPTQTSSSS